MIQNAVTTVTPLLLALILPGTALEVELLQSVGARDGPIFLEIEGIAGWQDGRCVISDRLTGSLTLLDEGFTVVEERETVAAGSGLSGGPASLDCHGELIAVADFASTQLQIFSAELVPTKRFHAEGPVIDLKFAPDGTLWICAQTHRGKALLHYDIDGLLLGRVLPAYLTGEPFSDVFLCAIDPQGMIFLVYCVRNIIEVRDSSGRLLHTRSVPGLAHEPPTRTVRRGLFRQNLHLPDGPLFRSAAADAIGNLLILGGDYGPHPGRDIYILSPQGECQVLVLPARASRISTTRAGMIYAVDDSKSRIDLYRISLRGAMP